MVVKYQVSVISRELQSIYEDQLMEIKASSSATIESERHGVHRYGMA